MTRQSGKSAAFAAAGRILSRPSMRPLTRTFSNLHAALYRLTRGSAQTAPRMNIRPPCCGLFRH